MSPKEWNEAGRPDIVERAAARKREILSTYYPDYLPRAIDELIRAKHDIKLPREVMEPGDPRWTGLDQDHRPSGTSDRTGSIAGASCRWAGSRRAPMTAFRRRRHVPGGRAAHRQCRAAHVPPLCPRARSAAWTRLDDWTRGDGGPARGRTSARSRSLSVRQAAPALPDLGPARAAAAMFRRSASTSTRPTACGTPSAPPCCSTRDPACRRCRLGPHPCESCLRRSPASSPARSMPSTGQATTWPHASGIIAWRRPAKTACGRLLARRACPVGQDYRYRPDQVRFHMQAFRRARGFRDPSGKFEKIQNYGLPVCTPLSNRSSKAGDIIILDGGTGTEIQRRGVPMNGETWCAEANLTHPDVVRAVHAIISAPAPTSSPPTPLPPARCCSTRWSATATSLASTVPRWHSRARPCEERGRRRAGRGRRLFSDDAAVVAAQRPDGEVGRNGREARPSRCCSARRKVSPKPAAISS